MIYMGSKNRIAKHLLPIILAGRAENQCYVEPFVGGCNMIDKVHGYRIGGDLNRYLIAMWKGLQKGLERPREISRDLYSICRDNAKKDDVNCELELFKIGWVGWMASYNGRFFDGGYSGLSGGRNYIEEQIKNTEKQIDNIKGVEFIHSSYENLKIPKNSIIYCDIPYKNTKQYSSSANFDYPKFWQWCRDKSNAGNKIFISEYNAPSDFKCVWEKEVLNTMHQKNTKIATERLFTI